MRNYIKRAGALALACKWSRRRDSHSGSTQWGGSGGMMSRAPRKRRCFELAEGSCQGAAQIILGVGMTARKTRAAELEDGLHLRARHAAAQQLLGDPLISNTPVGLGKPLRNPQPVQASLIGGRGCRGYDRSVRQADGRTGLSSSGKDAVSKVALSSFYQRGAVCGQASLGVEKSRPGGVATGSAPLRFLIGEAGQSV